MVKSMTGYGRGSVEEGGRSFSVEIKSVNNRYLDVNIRLPRQLSSLEDNIRKYVASKISRGKIDIYISQEKFSQDDITVSVDEKMAESYYNAFNFLKNKFELQEAISLALLAKSPDVVSIEKKDEDIETIWITLKRSLDEAIAMFIDMRCKEGLKLSKDIVDRCNLILDKVNIIEERSPKLIEDYREKIMQRVSEYLKEVEIDEARLLNEVAFFADKSNTTEEVVRLKSHIEQFKNAFSSSEPIGRKLDFIVQEMNRETNTIGSKANDINITNLVVDIKSEIEKIREQVQNIE